MYKKILFFIAVIWTVVLILLDVSSTEVLINTAMFIICLYCFSRIHFYETKRYPKVIGVIYIIALLSSLGVSILFDSIFQSIGYNLMLTLEFYLIYRNIKNTYYESSKSRFGYVILSIVFAILIIFNTIYEKDTGLLSYVYTYSSILIFLITSVLLGRFFSKSMSLIKGYYSYWIIGLCSIVLGGIDFSLIYLFQDGVINELSFALCHVCILSVCFVIYVIIKKAPTRKMKFKLCPICKTPNKITDTECFNCRIDLNHIQPVCPNCGESINSIYDNRCSHCRFDLNNYFSKKISDKNCCLLDVVSSEDKTLHKLLVSEGQFVTNYTKILEAKTHLWNVLDDINVYGKAFTSESTEDEIQGFIHLYEKNGKFAWSIYSPKVISNTHKEYKNKIEQEELKEKRRKKQAEVERQLEEENRIRKEKEEQEMKEKQAEKIKLQKQEHAKRISEQTGIILD